MHPNTKTYYLIYSLGEHVSDGVVPVIVNASGVHEAKREGLISLFRVLLDHLSEDRLNTPPDMSDCHLLDFLAIDSLIGSMAT